MRKNFSDKRVFDKIFCPICNSALEPFFWFSHKRNSDSCNKISSKCCDGDVEGKNGEIGKITFRNGKYLISGNKEKTTICVNGEKIVVLMDVKNFHNLPIFIFQSLHKSGKWSDVVRYLNFK